MANVGNAVTQHLGASLGKFGRVFRNFFNEAERTAAADEVIEFTKDLTKNPDRGWFGNAISLGTWGVRKPAELLVRGTSKVIDGVATAYGKAPIISSAVTVGAAGLGVVGVVNDRRGKREAMERQAEYEQQAAEMEAQQAMIQTQAQGRVSYKNSVSPQESMLLDERMRGGGQTPAHGQSVLDARAAAQAAQAPAANG